MRRCSYRATAPAIVAIALSLGAIACTPSVPRLEPSKIPEPAAGDIESVLFLLGDAGEALPDRDPVMRALHADVEQWAGAIEHDSAVVVLYLGDNVYPEGVHEQDHPEFPIDSTKLQAQVDVVNGPNARRRGVRGLFIPGNHDWGQAMGLSGVVRLHNQEALLDRMRERGTPVWMMPQAGRPGPQVLDVGDHLRILLLDTAWWLLTGEDTSKVDVYNEMRSAIETAGEREIVVAAHHPFRSASSHGGLMPFWSGLGIRFLLNRSGAVLQDLSSIAYRSLTDAFVAAFEAGPPLLFAGGHDHNLQVIEGTKLSDPRWMIVSGAGSKEDEDLGHVEGMRFRHSEAGYMRLMVHRDGRMDLFVIGAPGVDEPLCEQAEADARERCMVMTAQKFTDIYSRRLK